MVDTWISTASENGLFKTQDKIHPDSILKEMNDARINLGTNPPNFPVVDHHLDLAAKNYFLAVNSTSKRWRFLNVYAGHLFIYIIGFLASIFLFYYLKVDTFFVNGMDVPHVAIDATIWGIIGGLLRGIWFLWKNVNARQYRNAWIIWFVSTPFLGGILGAIVYLIIEGGLLTISQQTQIVNPIVVIVFSALAGFNWEWAMGVLKKIEGLLTTEGK